MRNSIREIRVSFNWPGKIKLWEGYFQIGERIPVIAHAGTPRPLLVLNLLAFICLRITCQLNLVIACVIRKQTIPFAPALPNLYICTPWDASVWDGEEDGLRCDESILISATFHSFCLYRFMHWCVEKLQRCASSPPAAPQHRKPHTPHPCSPHSRRLRQSKLPMLKQWPFYL